MQEEMQEEMQGGMDMEVDHYDDNFQHEPDSPIRTLASPPRNPWETVEEDVAKMALPELLSMTPLLHRAAAAVKTTGLPPLLSEADFSAPPDGVYIDMMHPYPPPSPGQVFDEMNMPGDPGPPPNNPANNPPNPTPVAATLLPPVEAPPPTKKSTPKITGSPPLPLGFVSVSFQRVCLSALTFWLAPPTLLSRVPESSNLWIFPCCEFHCCCHVYFCEVSGSICGMELFSLFCGPAMVFLTLLQFRVTLQPDSVIQSLWNILQDSRFSKGDLPDLNKLTPKDIPMPAIQQADTPSGTLHHHAPLNLLRILFGIPEVVNSPPAILRSLPPNSTVFSALLVWKGGVHPCGAKERYPRVSFRWGEVPYFEILQDQVLVAGAGTPFC